MHVVSIYQFLTLRLSCVFVERDDLKEEIVMSWNIAYDVKIYLHKQCYSLSCLEVGSPILQSGDLIPLVKTKNLSEPNNPLITQKNTRL